MHDGSTQAAGESPFWNAGTPETLASVEGRAEGLTKAEAAERLARFGPNLATANGHRSLLAKLGRKLGEPLVAILLIAAALSGATGDWRSFVVIAFIVLASTALDIVQEQKAETAVEALKRSVAVTAAVRRDGKAAQLPVRDIVPGDVIELRGGDVVPADGIVLSARGALANEALLTGEPYPAEKRPSPSPARSPAEAPPTSRRSGRPGSSNRSPVRCS